MEALINGRDGFVVFGGFGQEFFVLVLSDLGLFVKISSVLSDVGSKLVQLVLVSGSGGDQDVVNEVVSVEEVSLSIFDVSGELGDVSVMVIGSS